MANAGQRREVGQAGPVDGAEVASVGGQAGRPVLRRAEGVHVHLERLVGCVQVPVEVLGPFAGQQVGRQARYVADQCQPQVIPHRRHAEGVPNGVRGHVVAHHLPAIAMLIFYFKEAVVPGIATEFAIPVSVQPFSLSGATKICASAIAYGHGTQRLAKLKLPLY